MHKQRGCAKGRPALFQPKLVSSFKALFCKWRELYMGSGFGFGSSTCLGPLTRGLSNGYLARFHILEIVVDSLRGSAPASDLAVIDIYRVEIALVSGLFPFAWVSEGCDAPYPSGLSCRSIPDFENRILPAMAGKVDEYLIAACRLVLQP